MLILRMVTAILFWIISWPSLATGNGEDLMQDTPNNLIAKPAGLIAMRKQLEAQWVSDYLNGPPPESKQFDFLIGDWVMTRRSFDLQGIVTEESEGEMHARYVLEGRVIQEKYHSYLPDGRIFRGGVGLYTYIPSTG